MSLSQHFTLFIFYCLVSSLRFLLPSLSLLFLSFRFLLGSLFLSSLPFFCYVLNLLMAVVYRDMPRGGIFKTASGS